MMRQASVWWLRRSDWQIQLVVIKDELELIQKLRSQQVAERERRPVPLHVVINPKVVVDSDETVEFFEGCQSMVGFTAIVPVRGIFEWTV